MAFERDVVRRSIEELAYFLMFSFPDRIRYSRKEPRKLAQLHAFTAGFIDGLLGIKGRRHVWWRIG